jgi:hypothetical protein
MGGACGTYWGKGNTHRAFVGKNEGKIPLGRLSNRWEESKD